MENKSIYLTAAGYKVMAIICNGQVARASTNSMPVQAAFIAVLFGVMA